MWDLGTVGNDNSYRLAKYIDIDMSSLTSNIVTTKVGILRFGQLMKCQFNGYRNNAQSLC